MAVSDHPRSIPDIQLVMSKIGEALLEAALIPASITLRPEEDRPLIVIETVNLESTLGKETAHLRTDQPIRTGN